MQPSYYEDFSEIKKKIWSLLNNAVKDRSSSFRIPVFACGNQNDIDGRIVVLRKSDQKNNIVQLERVGYAKIESINDDIIELLWLHG